MQQILERLRGKSDAQKIFYAMFVSVTVVVLLFSAWTYNFAHSGKIGNMASSATSIAKSVEEADIKSNFSNAIAQLKELTNLTKGEESAEADASAQSAGARHMNVFVKPATQITGPQDYGDNPADELY